MPNSIQFTQEVGTGKAYVSGISSAPNLAELLDFVPAPYRPQMQDLVQQVYRAAVKSNNTRSYLANLEKHEQDGDFPPEIGARIAPPALQISKEYSATAEYRSLQAELDNNALANKKAALAAAILMKKKELVYLQSLFSEDKYRPDADKILATVSTHIVQDAGLEVNLPDGSSAKANWPPWIREDYSL